MFFLLPRPGDMWSLGDRPSLRFVKDILNAMRNKDVEIKLTAEPMYDSPAEPVVSQSGVGGMPVPACLVFRGLRLDG